MLQLRYVGLIQKTFGSWYCSASARRGNSSEVAIALDEIITLCLKTANIAGFQLLDLHASGPLRIQLVGFGLPEISMCFF
jgi:hypothetical protein